VDQKWQSFSLYKKGFFIILLALISYNVVINTHLLTHLLNQFLTVITPFIIGLAIAYLLARPVMKLSVVYEKSTVRLSQKKAHLLSVISVFLMLILAITLVMIYMTPIILSNVGDLIGNVETYYTDVFIWINSIEPDHFLSAFLPDGDEITSSELLNMIPTDGGELDVVSFINAMLTTVVINVVNVTTSLVNFGMGLIIALYLLLYKTSVLALVNRVGIIFLKPRALTFIKKYLQKSNEIFYKFISAQFLDACILGTLATLLLAVLRVEYAITFGLLLGIFNMIPFFGSIIATLITVFVTFFTGGLQQALIVFGALLALQQLDAQFINPKITGDSLGMNPLVIVTAIFMGGAYMGVVGMFMGVPVAAMLKVFLEDFLAYREKKLGIKTG